jgi:hypothetical protein
MRVATIVSLLLAASAVHAVTEGEQDALVRLLIALNGDRWFIKEGWTTSPAATQDPCAWFGVVCDTDSRVVTLDLQRNNLAGSIANVPWSAFTSLRHLDLSSNAVNGTLPDALLALPSIIRVRLSRNGLTTLPTIIYRPDDVSPSLEELYLERNRFRCPLPRWTELNPIVASAWVDFNTTTCLSTPTMTRVTSFTIIAEPPVPDLADDFESIPRLLIATSLDVQAEDTLNRFKVTVAEVAVADALVPPPATNTSLDGVINFYVSQTTADGIIIEFTPSVGLEFRRNLYSRFRSFHESVRSLAPLGVSVLAAQDAPAAKSYAGAAQEDDISRGAVVAILVVGILLVVVLFAVLGICCFRRRKAFTAVQPMPAGPPLRKQPLGTMRSLRAASTAAPTATHSFARTTSFSVNQGTAHPSQVS